MNINHIPVYDRVILIIALVMLFYWSYVSLVQPAFNLEKFIDPQTLSKFNQVSAEEDITEISPNLVTYLTVFNIQSIDNNSNNWNNISNNTANPTCTDETLKKLYTFEQQPVFSRKTGVYFGSNRLVGPYSNMLDIKFNNTFTIILVCKHGNLLVDNKNNELELLKLYANSPNNNAMSFFIQKDSIKNSNNTQTGNLLFQYANNSPIQCKIDKDHSFISLDKDVLTFYYIVKDTDNIRILQMTENSNVMKQILKFNISNTDITFSNKEISINRLLNWNGNMFNFAIYKQAFMDDQVSKFYTHVMNEYLKNIDPNFTGIMEKYNEAVDLLRSVNQCPYDKPTCEKCSMVTQWNNMNQILTASVDCKKSISDFCDINRSHPLCKCWDQSSPLYNTDSCQLFRSMFTGDKRTMLEGLTPEELESLMKKYGLMYPNQCPANIKEPNQIKNNYSDYEWEKLKVSLDPAKKIDYIVTNDTPTEPPATAPPAKTCSIKTAKEELEPPAQNSTPPSAPSAPQVSDKLQNNSTYIDDFIKLLMPV